ncbi:hypothetical protein HY844_01325 [Candidatus Berkelbacteria bacterium]|nr:hypothetical protein [Candidatus Berkelbacteria bacterium]
MNNEPTSSGFNWKPWFFGGSLLIAITVIISYFLYMNTPTDETAYNTNTTSTNKSTSTINTNATTITNTTGLSSAASDLDNVNLDSLDSSLSQNDADAAEF